MMEVCMKKLVLFKSLLLAILGLLMSSAALAQPNYEKATRCYNEGIIMATNGVLLHEHPDYDSRIVMKLHNGQLLCLVDNKDKVIYDSFGKPNKWLLVKKLEDNSESYNFSDSGCEKTPEGCTILGNYPTPWLIEKPEGPACKAISKIRAVGTKKGTAEYMEYTDYYTKGVCATGWIRSDEFFYLGD